MEGIWREWSRLLPLRLKELQAPAAETSETEQTETDALCESGDEKACIEEKYNYISARVC